MADTPLAETKTDEGRRRFMKLATMGIGGIIGVVTAVPLLRYFLHPVGRSLVTTPDSPIDIAADAGTPVNAAADGTVAAITRDTDQVPILVLRHADNMLTVYAGVDNVKVQKGDTVKRGQPLPAFFRIHCSLEAGQALSCRGTRSAAQ